MIEYIARLNIFAILFVALSAQVFWDYVFFGVQPENAERKSLLFAH